jgi:glycosyltransferase involved in cell wall biosynthesis
VIETNVFGLVDAGAAARAVDRRLFLSRMCALRYRRDAGLDGDRGFHRRHRVLPLPVDVAALRAGAPPRDEAKRALGLDPERPVVGRVGRADDLKWRNLLVDMLPDLLARAPEAQVLLVGVTPAKVRRLHRRGVLGRCVLRDPVADESELATLYAACDVLVAAAELGESQGLALAEAMALGVPVVTCSTPWVDNAQVELVEHGRTGWIANHPAPFAEAVARLLADGERRSAFAAAGREVVEREFEADRLTRRLESLYAGLLDGTDDPAGWHPGPEEVEAFATEYERRLRLEYRPLRPRERRQARAARERERAVRVAGLLRPSRLPLAWAMLRARLRPPQA